jgi:dipeptidyl aminopeptidase/acylaminoacyl peptidase
MINVVIAVLTFTLPSVLGYPYPTNLVSGAGGAAIAWVLDERGVRNVFVATAPDYRPRMVTSFAADDGQEITSVEISRNGQYLVFVRGGDHDANWPPSFPPDPASSPVAPEIKVWSVALSGAPKATPLASGDTPAISPDNRRVAFIAPDQSVSIVALDGSGKVEKAFFDEGQDSDLQWSPDGSALAFVSTRKDHSFIGIYRDQETPLEFLAPSTSKDLEPRWSPDDKHIAFLRTPGDGGPPTPLYAWNVIPWSIWVADTSTGDGKQVWSSGTEVEASFPYDFDPSLRWTKANRLTFATESDGWPHLYAVSPSGGNARLLTPGAFMVEDTALSSDGRSLVYSANTGKTAGDFERRHLFAVDVLTGATHAITQGTASEWSPAPTENAVAFVQAGAKQPPVVSILPKNGGTRALQLDRLPPDFPQAELVVPKSVDFRAADGHIVYGQLFEKEEGASKKPAVVFVHGGPPRQMLTTWHNIDYYSNAYAVNQYLADHGFVVLSVNYRLGIGYGYAYSHPANWGPTGASEYQDVVAGNEFLQHQPNVDPHRIGIWGGSYGGYLTALALARNSDRFCVGADWHGVHDWSTDDNLPNPPLRYQTLDMQKERRIAWQSSPDASIPQWRSPVLLVQGDDDHNVPFHQTVDLARRLELAHVPFSELVIPNEIHGFLRYATFLKVDEATVKFLVDALNGSCRSRQDYR